MGPGSATYCTRGTSSSLASTIRSRLLARESAYKKKSSDDDSASDEPRHHARTDERSRSLRSRLASATTELRRHDRWNMARKRRLRDDRVRNGGLTLGDACDCVPVPLLAGI